MALTVRNNSKPRKSVKPANTERVIEQEDVTICF